MEMIRYLFFIPIGFLLDKVQAIFYGNKGNVFLENNFAPVDKERFDKGLEVKGEIPESIRGEFVRNGPNPQNIPSGGYHWFDGAGMINGVMFNDDGTVNYVNRMVRNYRYELEKKRGNAEIPRLGEMKGILGLLKLIVYQAKLKLGIIEKVGGNGSANTSVVFNDGNLLCLVENDTPFGMKILMDGAFEEIGRKLYECNGEVNDFPFSAHPKADLRTGELISFGYSLQEAPFLKYYLINNEGNMDICLDIPLDVPVVMHDMAITENYSIFLDFPVEFHPEQIVKSGYPIVFVERKSRFGVTPRYSENSKALEWFEFEPGYAFHVLNSWEEGDEIVVVACRSRKLQFSHISNSLHDESSSPFLYEFRINLETKTTSERRLYPYSNNNEFSNCVEEEENNNNNNHKENNYKHALKCEFPVIHPYYLGRKNNYGYVATISHEREEPLFDGVVKIDMTDEEYKIIGQIKFGKNKFGGECQFIPRNINQLHNNQAQFDELEEDDGYLITFVYDEDTDSSSVWIMDAQSFDPEPLAVITLHQRVPYGFHGIFVSSHQILNQKLDQK
eukprot:TRINITY_DN785_c0_g2_i1.p1 TRINITY_DN785_c0_g2~~TRINITY_DN785_c0_g2_i1.p1  ORF type:complete len:560 (+),score=206.38 TRINITY_DN785_c0_g2_i1:97-1776(+)